VPSFLSLDTAFATIAKSLISHLTMGNIAREDLTLGPLGHQAKKSGLANNFLEYGGISPASSGLL
jgi:hypothetical protein